ncbi:hypothetical protein BU14_0135s0050 [Porphyra umbilicalis]|uniref:Uncharacterized protein n=1 Tax=Porphyra umbilicalis TaxID=2786 RepID=A0A1X6PAN0_PORUM|nr:hypothetical protein BU14_0135s0050 [Porphyra umbilicalis]|eukprot:OSX77776.1 hypothetical protein BU14_0135s0050 [Porphyra umbilicalis]
MGPGTAGGGAGARQRTKVIRLLPAVFLSIEVGKGGLMCVRDRRKAVEGGAGGGGADAVLNRPTRHSGT